METLRQIGIDNQIENVIEGVSKEEADQVEERIKLIASRIGNIVSINGSKVYDPIVNDKNIEYNLQKCPEWLRESMIKGGTRKYYYPIQYATIILK